MTWSEFVCLRVKCSGELLWRRWWYILRTGCVGGWRSGSWPVAV